MSEYVLARGQEGARRLELLAAAMWPSTKAVLQRAGVGEGTRCLDVGCGIGTVTCELARLSGHCEGIDVDPGYIEIARARAKARQVQGARFQLGSCEELQGQGYDLVYARYLLSHLPDPLSALRRLITCVRPGGTVVIEDVDFPGHFHHPPNAAFQRYLQLYQQVVGKTGGNASFGRELLATAREAGLEEIEIELVVSVHNRGPGKLVAELTLEQTGDALIAHGLTDQAEIDRLLEELRDYRQDANSLASLAPTFQLVARVQD